MDESERLVVVGLDGVSPSVPALRHAAEQARVRQARLEVVGVVTGAHHHPITSWLRLRRLVAAHLPVNQHVTTHMRVSSGDPIEVFGEAADRAVLLVVAEDAHVPPTGCETTVLL